MRVLLILRHVSVMNQLAELLNGESIEEKSDSFADIIDDRSAHARYNDEMLLEGLEIALQSQRKPHVKKIIRGVSRHLSSENGKEAFAELLSNTRNAAIVTGLFEDAGDNMSEDLLDTAVTAVREAEAVLTANSILQFHSNYLNEDQKKSLEEITS